MYAWIWRHLPGPVPVRALTALLLAAGFAALLWYGLFPVLDRHFFGSDGTVTTG
nr:hypothetical protein GCM10017745_49640 [Saccharothrix mutabilis subsp. capreolus]